MGCRDMNMACYAVAAATYYGHPMLRHAWAHARGARTHPACSSAACSSAAAQRAAAQRAAAQRAAAKPAAGGMYPACTCVPTVAGIVQGAAGAPAAVVNLVGRDAVVIDAAPRALHPTAADARLPERRLERRLRAQVVRSQPDGAAVKTATYRGAVGVNTAGIRWYTATTATQQLAVLTHHGPRPRAWAAATACPASSR
jgi:hypothetical protein